MSDMEKSINQFYEQARSLAHSIPICDLGSSEGLIAIEIGLREAYRMGREAGRSESAESHEEAENFIKEAIDSAPEPLRRLGEYLARVLDEDHWKEAERMLLGAAGRMRNEPN